MHTPAQGKRAKVTQNALRKSNFSSMQMTQCYQSNAVCTTIPLITHLTLKIYAQQRCYALSHYGAASRISVIIFFVTFHGAEKHNNSKEKHKLEDIPMSSA